MKLRTRRSYQMLVTWQGEAASRRVTEQLRWAHVTQHVVVAAWGRGECRPHLDHTSACTPMGELVPPSPWVSLPESAWSPRRTGRRMEGRRRARRTGIKHDQRHTDPDVHKVVRPRLSSDADARPAGLVRTHARGAPCRERRLPIMSGIKVLTTDFTTAVTIYQNCDPARTGRRAEYATRAASGAPPLPCARPNSSRSGARSVPTGCSTRLMLPPRSGDTGRLPGRRARAAGTAARGKMPEEDG
jgi:hypothetical protein